ncbi:DedA family protein [Streptomyces spongiae]|uniref:DedA family protein n=1 Tax=Streptomyces spongiae TaxID=565072 RepID=A0A5N8XUB0_9ACTN|nr:VTT domain-containing protein [Streptomyces spongiae]MPY62971.1 DedA family protein [Streptomyces spongiae]
MNAFSDILGHISPAAAYTVVAAAVLAESILLVGAFIPTLTLLLTAGALARTGHISLPLVIAAAAGAVVGGDFLAHRTGRFLGDRLRGGRTGRRIPGAAWHHAETLMTRHGGRAVFLARFLPVVRTLAPHFAGATRLPYRRIAPYSVVAACVWATAEAGVGYAAATSLQRILTLGGPAVELRVIPQAEVHGRSHGESGVAPQRPGGRRTSRAAWQPADPLGPSRAVKDERSSSR